MRKISKILLASLLMVTLIACGTTKNESKTTTKKDMKFDEFVETLPSKMLENTDASLNFLFVDKKKHDYKEKMYEHQFLSLKDYKKSMKESDDIYDALEEFNRDDLTKKQRLTYDVLKDAFSTKSDVSIENSYYLSVNYLDSNYGEPGNLPITMYAYKFRNKQDVESYLHLMETAKDFFGKIVAHEQVRQDKGYGMTPSHIDTVLKQAQDFIDGDHAFLIDTFNEKIAALEGISEDDKTAYKEKNETLANVTLKEAYTQLKTDLSGVKVKSKDIGLAQFEGGKDYYEELIQEYVGFDDIEDYRKFLEGIKEEKLTELQKMYNADKSLEQEMENMVYTNAKSAEEVVLELEEKTKEDFPALRSLSYEMPSVPESMRSIATFAAAYFISPVDEANSKERMILNGDYKQEDFKTIAHEGYPGHMYQIQYYKEQNHPVIRQLFSYSGYTEGYANYVEHYSAKYAEDAEVARFATLYDQFTYANLLLIDINIHYDGYSKTKVKKEIEAFYGSLDDESMSEIYGQLLNAPGIFSKYSGSGYRLEKLKEAVKKKMGSKYTDKAYHEALLNVGPAPYEIVETYVYENLGIKK